ncbi:M48 family metalloprotease [Kitasatospora sp. NPDC050543]|uniref:M48 family metalloprotease n=1 Tax=Kitasatospora sp. NPDC050543 TaxID=3364054 RepID=UPI0037B9CF61
MAPVGMPTGEPAVAAPPQPSHRPDVAPEHDDLALQSGRTHLRARQRGVDGAALSQLAVTLPTALISLFVVALVFSMINPVVGLVMTLLWLLSGFLVFHRPAEAAIARHLLGMRRPDPADAQRLDVVWEQVTRRAGVRHGTYELWIQDRTELNATAAAGHIVAVTRHALDRLTNSQLAAVLAHELGHHVGGHTWAGLLADWYALPARMIWRWTLVGLSRLLRSKNKSSMACGGCLSLILVQFLFALTFIEGMWWLVLPAAVGPLVVAWLRRRAEVRADDYATGLGFGDELVVVLEQEQRSRSTPQGAGPGPWPYPAQWIPPQPGAPTYPPSYPYAYPPPSPDGAGRAHVMSKAAHTNFEERLRQLRRNDRVTRR